MSELRAPLIPRSINGLLGEPIERDGTVVIPVARTRLGRRSVVIGAFVVQGGKVRWEPAFDLTAVALGGQLVGVLALLIVRSIVASRFRSKRHRPTSATPG